MLLTSYGMVLHNAEALAVPPQWLRAEEEDGALWDYMFLDEVPQKSHLLCVWCRSGMQSTYVGPSLQPLHQASGAQMINFGSSQY